MATAATARHPTRSRSESTAMNTIPDPRSPSPASVTSGGSSPSSGDHHPDLSNEVAALSTKLINAINHSTALDDSLQESRHELQESKHALQIARERIAQLEKAAKHHEELIGQGLLLQKEDVDRREAGLRNDFQQEKQQRDVAEKDKKRMESELETLTASLFEEANTMVASARKETDASNHKVEQLRTQLLETETLLSSHQEQLHDLKAVMQQMSDRDDNEAPTHLSSAPSTPGLAHNKMSRMFDAANLTPLTPGFGSDAEPQPPLFYQQLLTPILRSDLPAYVDFQGLLRTSKDAAAAHSSASSRVASGNFSGLSAMSIGLGSTSNLTHIAASNAATPPLTPNLPSSASSTGSPRDSLNLSQPSLPPLKESKYFKRCLPEDIEPTLRLDVAPGLSWLNKRSVLQGVIAGSLAIEPMPAPVSRNYGPIFACALCGENGKQEKFARKHQFRISEDGEGEGIGGGGAKAKAQRWPLCDFCLGRVRATCDFIGFLRMCQAGVWKADSPERIKDAWEEGVRLRERMFWSRIGGGVVPSFVPRNPDEARRGSAESKRSEEDPFKAKETAEKRVSIGKTVIGRKDSARSDQGTPRSEESEEQLARQFRNEMGIKDGDEPAPSHTTKVDAEQGRASNEAATGAREKSAERLSVTIPGAFAS